MVVGLAAGEAQLLELIDRVYAAALDPDLWDEAGECLGRALGSAGAMLHLRERRGLRLAEIVTDSWTDGARTAYFERHQAYDPLAARAARWPPRAVFSAEELMRSEELRSSAFYREWCRPHGVHRLLGVRLSADDEHFGLFAVHRRARHPPFGDRARLRMKRLAPHLERALQIHVKAQRVSRERDAAVRLLDRLAVAAIAVNANGQAIAANRRGAELVAEGDGLGLSGRHPVASTAAETAALRALIGGALRTPPQGGGALALARPSGRRPLNVVVAPLERGIAASSGSRAMAAIFAIDPDECRRTDAEWLRRTWELTPAEARLASLLATGVDLSEAARLVGVKVSTLRNQLKRVLHKTGTRRQAELVRLVVSSLPPLSPLPSHASQAQADWFEEPLQRLGAR